MSSHPDYPDHPARPAEEQELHDQVVSLLAERLQQEGFQDVRTNPGGNEVNVIEIEDKTEMFPDVFTVEDEHVTAVCEVETASTVDPDAVVQWQDYAALGVDFLLVVPQSQADQAEELIEENGVACDHLLTYEVNEETDQDGKG